MDIQSADSWLGPFGLTLKGLIVGAAASFISLRFFDGLERRERWMTFLGGWAMAAWGGAPLTAWLDIKPAVETLVVLLLGVFGMAVAAELLKLIRNTDWRAVLGGALERVVGRKPGGQ